MKRIVASIPHSHKSWRQPLVRFFFFYHLKKYVYVCEEYRNPNKLSKLAV